MIRAVRALRALLVSGAEGMLSGEFPPLWRPLSD